MRRQQLLPLRFKAFHDCHLSRVAVAPESPSSIVLSDEHHLEVDKMFSVTKNWFLENDVLLPSKLHLHDYCRRVATLLRGDRVVCFICTSPNYVGSCSVAVHLSRIQTQGGKLLQLVLPNVSKSSTKVFTVEVQESAIGMLAISDYLYRSHINFASMDISDMFEIASAAKKWECHDLFIGSLLHLVYKERLNTRFLLRATVSFRWLQQAPLIFVQYFCDRAGVVLPLLTFPQLLDVLHSAYIRSTTRLCDQVLHFIFVNDIVQTELDASLLLTVYHDIPIPLTFKEYFSLKVARFFFQLCPQRSVSETVCSDEEFEVGRTELGYPNRSPCGVTSKRSLIKLLHRNKILFETLQRIDESNSNDYDAKYLFWAILHHAEPLMPNKSKTVALLQRICARIDDRETLLSDESAWKQLSAAGMRIAALSLCSRRSYSPTLQFSVQIPWESLRNGSSMRTTVGSIDGVKFELKPRSTSKGSCSLRLYYSNMEGCYKPRTESYARVSCEFINSMCFCEDIQALERSTEVRLKDKNFRNGSLRDLHTEGELTVLDEREAEEWCNRHQESCTLSIFVRVEL